MQHNQSHCNETYFSGYAIGKTFLLCFREFFAPSDVPVRALPVLNSYALLLRCHDKNMLKRNQRESQKEDKEKDFGFDRWHEQKASWTQEIIS